MKELMTYKHHAIMFLTAVKKPTILIPAVGMASFSSCQMGLFLLMLLMTADFVTGVLGSWNLWKDSKIQSNFWKYGFSSQKIRLSIVKSVTYFLFILLSYGVEIIFRIKSFGSNKYSDHEITLTLVAIALACAIEFYSIFFENLPKAGFDIEKKVKEIFGKIKNAITSVKDIANGDEENNPT